MAIHHKTAHLWAPYELALITEVTERSWAHIERVRSEAEVREGERRFREELERQVDARTADLQLNAGQAAMPRPNEGLWDLPQLDGDAAI